LDFIKLKKSEERKFTKAMVVNFLENHKNLVNPKIAAEEINKVKEK
jgi:hypothetical protein